MTNTFVSTAPDLLTRLSGIAADSDLALARSTRDAATRSTQDSYQALFEADDIQGLPLSLRVAVAVRSAQLHEDALAIRAACCSVCACSAPLTPRG